MKRNAERRERKRRRRELRMIRRWGKGLRYQFKPAPRAKALGLDDIQRLRDWGKAGGIGWGTP